MAVEFVSAAHVREISQRIREARQRAVEQRGTPPRVPDERYWESLFEANAAEALASIDSVHLAPGYAVRYRYFGQHGGDMLVRPFVARASTDVDPIRPLIDWHAAPDSVAASAASMPTQDVELLYRHFTFPATPAGFFDYWLAMQELWASGRWVHASLLASAAELNQITARDGWEVVQTVESYEPAVVQDGRAARLAVLIQSPLRRFEITLQQIDIAVDQSIRYADPILVASGPRGYVL